MQKELKDQAKEILKLAQNYGVEQNLFFVTTFERYQTQLQILDEWRVTIEKDGFFIDKTYVKGETNLYSHPAVAQFNRNRQRKQNGCNADENNHNTSRSAKWW